MHARDDSINDVVKDTPEVWRKGWRKTVQLDSFFLFPDWCRSIYPCIERCISDWLKYENVRWRDSHASKPTVLQKNWFFLDLSFIHICSSYSIFWWAANSRGGRHSIQS